MFALKKSLKGKNDMIEKPNGQKKIIKEILTFSIYCTTLWQKSFQIMFSLIDIACTIQIQEKLTFIIQTPVDMMKEELCHLNN